MGYARDRRDPWLAVTKQHVVCEIIGLRTCRCSLISTLSRVLGALVRGARSGLTLCSEPEVGHALYKAHVAIVQYPNSHAVRLCYIASYSGG